MNPDLTNRIGLTFAQRGAASRKMETIVRKFLASGDIWKAVRDSGKSRATIYRYAKKLEETGTISDGRANRKYGKKE